MKEKTVKTEMTEMESSNSENTEKIEKIMVGKEKWMIMLFIILLIVLTFKSNLFDEVKNLSPEEQQFKDFVEYSVARDNSGILEDAKLLGYQVYDIDMADEDQKAVLRYEDPKTEEMVEIVQNGRYSANVRGYFLWILPIRQFSVTAEIQK